MSDSGIDIFLSNNFSIKDFKNSMRKILQVHIMSDHNKSDFFSLIQFQKNIQYNMCVSSVQITSWLIQKKNLRFICQRSSNCNSLLLAT